MHQHPVCDALSTDAMICAIQHSEEGSKLGLHDFVILAERLAATLCVCELVHLAI